MIVFVSEAQAYEKTFGRRRIASEFPPTKVHCSNFTSKSIGLAFLQA